MLLKTLLIATAFLISNHAFALTEKNQALFDKMAVLMKEEIRQSRIKDREGREMEDPGKRSILMSLENSARYRENELESGLTSVLAHFDSAQAKEAANELKNSLTDDRMAAEAAEVNRLQGLLDRAVAVVRSAKTAQEFDGILVELANANPPGRSHQSVMKINSLTQQVEAMKAFVAQWQSYIAAVKVNNFPAARQALNYLVNSTGNGQVQVFPRSEIIELSQKLDQASGEPMAAVLALKSLDDLGGVVEKVRSAQENGPRTTDYSALLMSLTAIEKTYREYQAGLPYILLSENQQMDHRTSQAIPKLVELRVMLLKTILPRYLDAPKDFTATENETVNEFLDRIAADAKAREDLDLLSRVIGAKRTLVRSAIENNDDVAGLRSYSAGRNQERAGQFDLATASYQEALKSGSDVVPAEKIGERLAGIKTTHSKEYQIGMELFLKGQGPNGGSDRRR